MSKITPEIQSFIQKWQLDNYEVETLLAVEWVNPEWSLKGEKEWRKALKGFAQKQTWVKV